MTDVYVDPAAIRNLIADAQQRIEDLRTGCLGELTDRLHSWGVGDPAATAMLAGLVDAQLETAHKTLSELRNQIEAH